MTPVHCMVFILIQVHPSSFLLLFAAGVFSRTQNSECKKAELINAEHRMMVRGIECETGRYIIYDKLISYMPDPNPNPKG